MDPGLTSYVQQVGQRLSVVSDRKLPYEFAVLNNSIPNAWALPGGKICITRGMLGRLDSEDGLAAAQHRRLAEEGRVSIRNVRREANEKLKTMAKDKHVSQDEERRGHDAIQKTTDKFTAKVDAWRKASADSDLSARQLLNYLKQWLTLHIVELLPAVAPERGNAVCKCRTCPESQL